MIETNDLLAFSFYKKNRFTGSHKNMRYRIQKTTLEEADYFEVILWKGPYVLEKSVAQEIISNSFPFEKESLHSIADYLNQIYLEKKNFWENEN
ncbi:MAG: hypothetical protein ACK5ML_03175 [Lachnospiraceae bacterium]